MLRPATDADRDVMLTWRNHPEVREVSVNQHVIAPEEHAAWWEATKTRPDREVYIYERGGIPSGVVTFFDLDRKAGTSWWGYYLDNAGLEERGQLLPAWIQIQREAKKLAFGELGLHTLEGEVLERNEAVRRFNARNGFEEVERYTHEIDGEEVPVYRIRATRPATQDK
ncbi:UDP-4-amino-4,6-dideoxy-N-acetyl-beta-L-altrosamine N-acetyltransferase [Actinomycetota bacterium]